MLHLIFQLPLEQAVISRMGCGDDVMFLGAAVWNVRQGQMMENSLEDLLERGGRLFVLRDDLVMNGIDQTELLTDVSITDYSGFVELTVKNKVVKTWG